MDNMVITVARFHGSNSVIHVDILVISFSCMIRRYTLRTIRKMFLQNFPKQSDAKIERKQLATANEVATSGSTVSKGPHCECVILLSAASVYFSRLYLELTGRGL